MISKKTIIVIMFGALVLLIMGMVSAQQKKRQQGESSVPEDSALMTEVIIVPSQIPSRFHMQTPAGFTETSSEAYEKFFVRNDATVIVTGEKMPGIGGQLDVYAAQVKEMYEQTADEFSLVKEETKTVNGETTHIMEFTYAIIGNGVNQKMQCLTALFVKDDHVYIVTCKSYLESYSLYRELFRQAIDTVTIDDEEIPSDAIVQGETVPTQAAETAAAEQPLN